MFEKGSILNQLYAAALENGFPTAQIELVEPQMIKLEDVQVPLPKTVNALLQPSLDLRLPHDGNPLIGDSGPLHDMRDDVLRVIDSPAFAHVVLIGSSGCGKTTTSFMVAKERFCIYLECWEQLRDGSASRLSFHMNRNKMVDETELGAIRRRFKREVLARCALLAILHKTRSITPYQWLLLSLSDSWHFNDMLKAVRKTVKTRKMDFDHVFRAVTSQLERPPSLIVDEANLLVGERKVQFNSDDKVDAFGASVKAVSSLSSHLASCIWIGTKVRLEQSARVTSAVAKTDGRIETFAFCSFPYISAEEFSIRITSILGSDFAWAAGLLYGRARPLATLVQRRVASALQDVQSVIAEVCSSTRVVDEIQSVMNPNAGFGDSDLLDLWAAAICYDPDGNCFCPERYGGTLAFTDGFAFGLNGGYKTGGRIETGVSSRPQLAFKHIVDEPILVDGIISYFLQKGGDSPHDRLYHRAADKCVNFGGEPSIRGQLLDVAVLCKAVSSQGDARLDAWLPLAIQSFDDVRDATFNVSRIVSGKGVLQRWLDMVLTKPDDEFFPGLAARNVCVRPETMAGADGAFAAFRDGTCVIVTIACAWYSEGVPKKKWQDQADRSSRLERQFLQKEKGQKDTSKNEAVKELLNQHNPLTLRVLFELPTRQGSPAGGHVQDGALVVDKRNVHQVLCPRFGEACK